MRSIRVGLATALIVAMLVACAGLVPKAETFDQKVAYGNATLTGIVNGTTSSLDAHQISSADAKKIRGIAENAKDFLDAADTAGDVAEGRDKLSMANAILTELQTYINNRSKQK